MTASNQGMTRREFLLAALAAGATVAMLVPRASRIPEEEFYVRETRGPRWYQVSGTVVENSHSRQGFPDYPQRKKEAEQADLEKRMGQRNNQYRTVIKWRAASPTKDQYWPWISSIEFSENLSRHVVVGDSIGVRYQELFLETPRSERQIGYLVVRYEHPNAGSVLVENEHLF